MVRQENRPSMLDVWVNLAKDLTRRSTFIRKHVAAVVVSHDLKTIYGYGYNGNYRGGPNTCDRAEVGNCGCIHAEDNAFINSLGKDKNMTMIATVIPCITCAKRIVNDGNIKLIYYLEEYRNNEGREILESNGVNVLQYERI